MSLAASIRREYSRQCETALTLEQLDHLTQWVNKAVIPNKHVNEKTTPKIRKIILIKLTISET